MKRREFIRVAAGAVAVVAMPLMASGSSLLEDPRDTPFFWFDFQSDHTGVKERWIALTVPHLNLIDTETDWDVLALHKGQKTYAKYVPEEHCDEAVQTLRDAFPDRNVLYCVDMPSLRERLPGLVLLDPQ